MTSTPSQNLANLAKYGNLDAVPESPELARNKLESARKRLSDAQVERVSKETRFDAAYNAIRDSAEIGLLMHGYRTSSSKPGHHQIALQCLEHTLGVERHKVNLIDKLRKQRNLSDYEGDPVPDGTLAECIAQAVWVIARVEQAMTAKGWLPAASMPI